MCSPNGDVTWHSNRGLLRVILHALRGMSQGTIWSSVYSISLSTHWYTIALTTPQIIFLSLLISNIFILLNLMLLSWLRQKSLTLLYKNIHINSEILWVDESKWFSKVLTSIATTAENCVSGVTAAGIRHRLTRTKLRVEHSEPNLYLWGIILNQKWLDSTQTLACLGTSDGN
jgi:hypothetical protein